MEISTYWLRSVCVVRCYLAALILSMALTPVVFGQSATTGALTGTIKDSSGAVVPNASVTATSIATGQVRATTTSANGTYTIGLLTPGDYRVKFEASGFKWGDSVIDYHRCYGDPGARSSSDSGLPDAAS